VQGVKDDPIYGGGTLTLKQPLGFKDEINPLLLTKLKNIIKNEKLCQKKF